MLALAHCLQHGVGVPADAAAATAWLQRAAALGDPLAAAELAVAVDRAAGTYLSPAAVKLWRRAAEGGLAFAAHNVGVSYLIARPAAGTTPAVPIDAAAALVWFRRAADGGFIRSAVNAGALLETGGPGLAAAPADALAYYKRAAALLEERAPAAVAAPTVAATTPAASAASGGLASVGTVLTPAVAPLARMRDVIARRIRRLEAKLAGAAVADGDVENDADVVVRLDYATPAERDAALAAAAGAAATEGLDTAATTAPSTAFHLVQQYAAKRRPAAGTTPPTPAGGGSRMA